MSTRTLTELCDYARRELADIVSIIAESRETTKQSTELRLKAQAYLQTRNNSTRR